MRLRAAIAITLTLALVALAFARVDAQTEDGHEVRLATILHQVVPTMTPSATTAPLPEPSPTPVHPARCHPSYPTVCIPPPPPDLDCGDIPYRDFPVRPPDPHRFDTDEDGKGCET